MNNVTLETVPSSPRIVRILVKNPFGVILGLIEKFKPSGDGSIHPWKAYTGIGHECKIAGFFYVKDGGKQAAIRCVAYGGKQS